jgi:CMP-N-acetylneuraminic acid synthetase
MPAQFLTACITATFNGNTHTTSGTYIDTLQNQLTCDSIVTTVLTIVQPATTAQTFTACGSYLYNGTNYTASTVVTENLQTIHSCDSTVTTTIVISPIRTTAQTFTACGNYVYNGTNYTASTVVTENLQTIYSCDSTVTTTIVINPIRTTAQTFTACGSYTYNGVAYTASTVVTENLQTIHSCDSTVMTTIVINPIRTSAQTFTACGNYVYNGTNYTASTVVTENLQNIYSCDSTVTTTIVINPVFTLNMLIDTTLCNTVGSNITVQTTGGTPPFTYQLDAQSQASPQFTALSSGVYTVTVMDSNICTQSAIAIISCITDTKTVSEIEDIKIYPNPSTGILNIELSFIIDTNVNLTIFDALGRQVQNQTILVNSKPMIVPLDLSTAPTGVYFLQIQSSNGSKEDILNKWSHYGRII